MPTLAPPPAAPKAPDGFSVMSPTALRQLGECDIDLYILPEHATKPVLLGDGGLQIDGERALELAAKNNSAVLVRAQDHEELSRGMLERLDELVADDSLPPEERFALVQFAAAAEVEHACKLVGSDRLVELSDSLGSSITTLLNQDEMAPQELFNIAQHDYHTFTHVTNVACYAVMLAEALGIRDEDEQREIAMGAFLHDIGKRKIPGKILRKPGRLTDEERAIIQGHSQYGYEELRGRDDVTRNQLLMVYQHHEWVNGCGYPVGVTADELHPWSRLLAVVDVFDAMTGCRPYRKPAPPEDVLNMLTERAGEQFDAEMVKCWKHKLATS